MILRCQARLRNSKLLVLQARATYHPIKHIKIRSANHIPLVIMGKDGSDAATPSSGFKKSFASIFKSPAAEAYTRVLANSATEAEGDTSSIYSDLKAGAISDKEKARILVEQRNASSPTGDFVLGVYKPAGASQGYGGYYAAKALNGK